MDILYASTMYPPSVGGAQLHLHCLAKEMQAVGLRAEVVTHSTRNRTDWVRLATVCHEPARVYVHEDVTVRVLGFSNRQKLELLPWAAAYYPCMGLAVPRISNYILPQLEALSKTPRLVHVSRIGREFLAHAALRYARRRDVPFVLTPNHHPRWRGFLYREYDKIYRAADALFALTEAEKRALIEEKGARPERVHVTGVGPLLADTHDIAGFRQRAKVDGRFVLFLGQHMKHKGLAALLAALPSVWKKHPDVKFVFIGPPTGYSRSLFSRQRDPRVVSLGKVDLETKTSALAACEFLCVPSLQESFGGVYVEAWMMGRAVIGGRIPPIQCVVEDGVDGLLTTQNVPELSEAICQLLESPRRCEAMGRAGQAKAARLYTWPRLAEATRAAYRAAGATLPEPLVEPRRPTPVAPGGAADA